MPLFAVPDRTPSQQARDRITKVVMVGIVLPIGLLLLLQATRYSLFPGKANLLWAVFKVGVFGVLLFNAVGEWLDRRRKQANTR